jgi:hypothetical protein
MHWDKDKHKFVFEGVLTEGDNGPVLNANTGADPDGLSVADVKAGFEGGIYGWCEGYSAEVAIAEAALDAGSGAGAHEGGVSYFVESLVLPGDTNVPSAFVCIQNCLTKTKMATFSSSDSEWPYTNYESDYTETTDAVDYTWTTDSYQLKQGSDAINQDTLGSGGNIWDCYRMQLVADSDTASLKYDVDDDGTDEYWQAKVKELSTYYQFETGYQEWCNSVFLKDASDAYVQFSAPLRPEYTVTTAASSAKAGVKLNLHYEGFGELHGIPSYCINTDTNEETNCWCSSEAECRAIRHVSEFAIPEGDSVTANGNTYWVKPLESEVRFKQVSGTSASLGVTMGSVTSLPAAVPASLTDADDPSVAANANYAGAWDDTLFDLKASVVKSDDAPAPFTVTEPHVASCADGGSVCPAAA